jgi:hypothetical protein
MISLVLPFRSGIGVIFLYDGKQGSYGFLYLHVAGAIDGSEGSGGVEKSEGVTWGHVLLVPEASNELADSSFN